MPGYGLIGSAFYRNIKNRMEKPEYYNMKTDRDLKQLLQEIDHRGYPAYKDTKGSYRFDCFLLSIDHVQGDPFAAPSDVSVVVEEKRAAFPKEYYDTKEKKTALEDAMLRSFAKQLAAFNHMAKGSGKSGTISVTRPGSEILERTSCEISEQTGNIRVRLMVGFPANGRTINSRELMKILFDFLPVCVKNTFFYERYDPQRRKTLQKIKELAEDQTEIRRQLKERGLVAFVANGSVLPRESGASDKPMPDAIKFQSPASMEMTMELPNRGAVTGMGIAKGITLIVGGGYHGKSTLLKALESGVYNHIAGDGRELVITDETAVKSRAEDGRSIHNVDISMFINRLPNGKDTVSFTTEDASGSTSQAAGVAEAVEAGARTLLMDEDTSATNFMIRDELMQRVVNRDKEPIIPFIDRIRELYEIYGISTVLVAGSSGSYFYVADRIVQMDRYEPVDITERAKKEAAAYQKAGTDETQEGRKVPPAKQAFTKIRVPLPLRIFQEPRLKIRTQGMDAVSIDHESIDLRLLEQLSDVEQLNALGQLLKYAHLNLADGKKSIGEVVDLLERIMDEKGLSAIGTKCLARPRRQEIFACFNRYRSQKYRERH